jgi:hypothetical protein
MRTLTAALLLLGLAAASLPGATIRGVVLENLTGHPLMRTVVAITPVAGGSGTSLSTRTNRYGAFEFPPLPAGSYLVSAARPGFAPTHYGQKEWRSAGVPIVLSDTDDTFLNIRMKRFGAISGTVVDENEVGLPEVTVVAYRNTRPPELIGKAITDDRGIYRIFGLEPGAYLVRSTAKDFSNFAGGAKAGVVDDGYVPTFFRQTGRVDEAVPVEVRLDEQSDFTNIKAEPGRLLLIGGTIFAGNYLDAPPTTVMLVSDMGRESVTTTNDFRFNPVAPGQYELFAETPPDRRGNRMTGYLAISMDRDRPDIRFPLASITPTYFRVQDSGGKPVDTHDIKIQARRRDVAGTDAPRSIDPARPQLLPPGRWEFSIAANPAWYVSAFNGPGYERSEQRPPDGWNEVILGSNLGNSVTFVLTAGPGSLQGAVTASSGTPVQGAPVFIESFDPRERRRLKDLATTRTDVRGHYQFYGLAPGTYRVLSTFEYQSPDEAAMERTSPRLVTIEGGRNQVQDLDLYVIQ